MAKPGYLTMIIMVFSINQSQITVIVRQKERPNVQRKSPKNLLLKEKLIMLVDYHCNEYDHHYMIFKKLVGNEVLKL